MTDGFALVDKPAGVTSHDMVAAVRRATGIRRVGHTGTLDPFATGLLVILIGNATRLLPYIPGEPKVYEATIAFGAETSTDDGTGEPRRVASAPLDGREIMAQLPFLTGVFEQMPPDVSAKQVGGRRAYAAARQGTPLQLQPVSVRVDAWDAVEYCDGILRARVTCGAGTYIRALARDLGRRVGSAAHLAALRRVQVGSFRIEHAVTIEDIRASGLVVRPPQQALSSLPHLTLSTEDAAAIRQGRAVPARHEGDRAALLTADGLLLAIAERGEGAWRPRVVLAHA